MPRHKNGSNFTCSIITLTRRNLHQKSVKYKWTLSSLTPPSSRVRTKTTLLIPIRPRPNKQLAEAHLCGQSIDVSRVDFFLPARSGWLLTLISFSCDEIPVCVCVCVHYLCDAAALIGRSAYSLCLQEREIERWLFKQNKNMRESVTVSSFRIFSIPVSHHESIHPSVDLSALHRELFLSFRPGAPL